MIKINNYNPFNSSNNFYIITEENKKFFCIDELKLEIDEKGYIPKSGLLFEKVLNKDTCLDKKVIDLGCGYLGILGVIAFLNGAKHIDSIDCDKNCVEWFNKLIQDNNLSKFNCFESDYFSNVRDTDYDLILTNPPQMPMLNGNQHDSGGIDGRKYILQILKESLKHLKDNAQLYILLFDFLGIDKRTNNNMSIVEIANNLGYSNSEIVFSIDKYIKNGSVTYDSITHIKQIYPLYEFETVDESTKKCQIKILKLEK